MPADWLRDNQGAIQAVAAALQVAIAIILVLVTVTYARSAQRQADQAERQVEQTLQQRFDQHRPVIHPSGELPLTNGSQGYVVDWSKLESIELQNVGTGVALTICGVLFGPEPETPPRTRPTRCTIWREPPLLPGSPSRRVKLEEGRTVMNGDATIGGHRLFAPRTPSRQERMHYDRYNVVARLTLTYQDIFRRKHAAVYDYIDLWGWQCTALLSGIAKDLEDVADEARMEMMPIATERLESA